MLDFQARSHISLLALIFTLTALAGCPKPDPAPDAGSGAGPEPVVTDAGGSSADAGPGVSGPVLDGGAEVCPTINPFTNIAGSSCRTEGQLCGPEGCIEPAPGACTFYLCQNGTWVLETLANLGDGGSATTNTGAATSGDAGPGDGGQSADAGQPTVDSGTDAGAQSADAG